MKTLDFNNPELLRLARLAKRRGEKLALLTKCAVDENTVAYWSDYFKQYGMQWVRPLALKKSANKKKAGYDYEGISFDIEGGGDEFYFFSDVGDDNTNYRTRVDAADAAVAFIKEFLENEGKQASRKTATQFIYDVSVRVEIEPWVTLLPDALEHSLKFALEAIKPPPSDGLTVDHVFVDIEEPTPVAVLPGQMPVPAEPRMVGYAQCAALFPDDKVAPEFAAIVESQLKKFLGEADFPCASIEIGQATKRTANLDHECIIACAREGQSLARLTSKFGYAQAKVARGCAVREAEAKNIHSDAWPILRFQAKRIIAQMEEEAPDFIGEPTSDKGAVAQVGVMSVQIKYEGLKSPNAFQWFVFGSDKKVLDQGESETWDQAVGDVKVALPKAQAKAEAAEAAEKTAIVASCGPVASIEKLASLGAMTEYRVQTKKDVTIWLTLQAGKVVDKVVF